MTGLVYHGPAGEPEYVTDSAYGIARASHSGAKGVDLNIRTCKARRFSLRRRGVVAHWTEWWKHGFKPKPGTKVPHKPIEQLTLAQVQNLVSVHGNHLILTVEQAALLCKLHHIIPFFEMKPSIWQIGLLRRLRAFCNARHIPFALMTIQAYGATPRARNNWERKAYQRLWLAKQAKAPTVLLYRRAVDWPRWAPVLDCIKGHAGHGDVLDLAHFVQALEGK
jgi:hypothetical protein